MHRVPGVGGCVQVTILQRLVTSCLSRWKTNQCRLNAGPGALAELVADFISKYLYLISLVQGNLLYRTIFLSNSKENV